MYAVVFLKARISMTFPMHVPCTNKQLSVAKSQLGSAHNRTTMY